MFKLPFKWVPGSWGLRGRTREIAEAEYELSGYDLEIRLLEISSSDSQDSNSYKHKLLKIQKKYNKVTQDEYDLESINLIEDKVVQNLALIEFDFKKGKLTDTEYSKKLATLKGEPWVNIVNMDFTQKSSLEGSFELDWNQAFVDKLKDEGYTGPTPDNIVNQWFMELCRNIAMEEFDGTGDFAADSEANLETVKRWNQESFPPGRKGYK